MTEKHAEAVAPHFERPVRPVAWAIFVDGGNARMWTTLQPHVQTLADAEGLDVTPMYALTPEDIAAVDAARKDRAYIALRRLDLCRCDHHEYCRHCHPVEFRPGGVWGGPNVPVT